MLSTLQRFWVCYWINWLHAQSSRCGNPPRSWFCWSGSFQCEKPSVAHPSYLFCLVKETEKFRLFTHNSGMGKKASSIFFSLYKWHKTFSQKFIMCLYKVMSGCLLYIDFNTCQVHIPTVQFPVSKYGQISSHFKTVSCILMAIVCQVKSFKIHYSGCMYFFIFHNADQ